MTNAEKVHAYLNEAKTFTFITMDGDRPKGRPFGFHMLVDGILYFGCGTFKNVFRQLTENPRVEVMAWKQLEFMRYDGDAVVVKDDRLLAKVREAMPEIMSLYDKNGWEMGIFRLDNGHVEIRDLFEVKDEFDV
ncbi:MAG: pyridoxamine 5'-phosphate oxidase family protein [Mailhella sp.]|nr:pyridoxamine 5'-phosphate oxidase family protein [Mailhella sp.]